MAAGNGHARITFIGPPTPLVEIVEEENIEEQIPEIDYEEENIEEIPTNENPIVEGYGKKQSLRKYAKTEKRNGGYSLAE